MSDYFPTKLAQGSQFCNRLQEKADLHDNISKCRHTVLIAPRRYGKSSLVFKVVDEAAIPLASIDLFLAHDDRAVTKRILDSIGHVISQLMPPEQKVLTKLQKIFSHFRISLTAAGFMLDVAVESAGFDPVDLVFNALKGLDELAQQQKHRCIIFFDEFQDISEASSSRSIQGAIRHIAQETSNISFIFSGSNRRLLMQLFDDKSKPLYMLCDMLKLERISTSAYLPHLQKLAKKRWNNELSLIVFEKIMQLTELHPYYVNVLCNELWKQEAIPAIEDVFSCWQQCYEIHEDRLIAELEKLSTKQQNILKALALNPVVQPTGQSFTQVAQAPISTITQTIKSLIDKDMVYRVKQVDELIPQLIENQLRVLDPLLAYALKKYS